LNRDKEYDMIGDSAISESAISEPLGVLRSAKKSLLLQSVVTPLIRTTDGEIIRVAMIPWQAILAELVRDPNFLHSIDDWRKMEELVAASYDAAGFDEVTLTSRSGDDGRDVIAVKRGLFNVRFFDQVKKFKQGHLVSPDDVRGMLGVLAADPNTSKGFVTTTSDFAPSIATNPKIQQFVPNRLELRNGEKLAAWLRQADTVASKSTPPTV
jgi:restriction system protein